MQNNGSVSQFGLFLHNKWIKLILAVDIVIIIAIIAILIFNATKSAAINFNVTPIDAKIQIDGQGEYYNGSYRVHPGVHTVTISRDGLDTKTLTIDLSADSESTVATFLSSDGNFDFYELKDNYQSLQKLIDIASTKNNQTTDRDTSAESFITTYLQKTSIADILPLYQQVSLIETDFITPIFFAVLNGQNGDYGCEQSFCLVISDTTQKNYDNALNLIKSKGYNPSDYEIIYTAERILPTGVVNP